MRRTLDLNDEGLGAMLDDTNNVYVIQYGCDDVMQKPKNKELMARSIET